MQAGVYKPRLVSYNDPMNATLTWTGQSMPNAGLLYQSYTDLGHVEDEQGRRIGEVLKTSAGFDARVPGIKMGDFATEHEAVAAVVDGHERYRS